MNAAVQNILFFAVANHTLTVVGSDGSYTKPFRTAYVTIPPGQTMDLLFTADQNPNHRYYMAVRVYATTRPVATDITTATATITYTAGSNSSSSAAASLAPSFPDLPLYNDTAASVRSSASRLRSLADKNYPVEVPLNVTNPLFFTISMNTFPCSSSNASNVSSCEGPNGTSLAASVNNISFVNPTSIDILEAYYYHVNGAFRAKFPSFPPLIFNFTGDDLPLYLRTPRRDTEVKVVEYGSTVEIVFQATSLVGGSEHPMHLHGFSFYVVGWGFGNFDNTKDPQNYNLVDPPFLNTITVPINGWTTIRFKAKNPGNTTAASAFNPKPNNYTLYLKTSFFLFIGFDLHTYNNGFVFEILYAGVWFMHCHFDRHMSWGMDMAFLVKNGKTPNARMLPPPEDMPPC